VVIEFLSSLSFLLNAFTAATYIFTAPTCTATIIEHYNDCSTLCIKMLSFSISYPDLIKFPYFADTTERGVWGEGGGKEAQNRVKTG